ncbi:MAG: ABC transporter ATP-binding protein [Cyanobacteria bacterium P01_F01_bin.150]
MLSKILNLKLSRAEEKRLRKGTIIKFIEGSLLSAPLIIVFLVLNELFDDSLTLSKVILLTVTLIICLFLQGTFNYWAMMINYPNAYSIMKHLRLQIGDHVRLLPMWFFSRRQTGDLSTIFTQDIKNIEPVPSFLYSEIIGIVTTLIVSSILPFVLNWRLGLAILVGLPLSVPIFLWSDRLYKQCNSLKQKALVEVNSRIIEYVQGISVVRAFNQTGARFNKLENALENYRKTNIDEVVKLVAPTMIFSGVLELGACLILLVGPYVLFGGQVTLPILIYFLVLSLAIYAPFQSMADLIAQIRTMQTALGRVEGVLKTQPLQEPHVGKSLNRFDIEFRNVSFQYEDRKVLHDVSFRVPERSITALVGPSGSGKTTITNLIARFWDVDDGEVLIGGVNIKDVKNEHLLSKISIVFQDVYLFNDTILNNIRLGKPDATFEQVVEAARLARCHNFIQELSDGYDTLVGEGGSTLSGGQKQRISIARAILKDTPIILLDEATAALDPENESLIQQAIDELVSTKTLIIIAHRLSTIKTADQILVLDQGRIIERGKHDDLLSLNGLYKRLWSYRQRAKNWKLSSTKRNAQKAEKVSHGIS